MAKLLKVRTGCVTCLIRKKKCDEQAPICGHCLRLNLKCVPRTPENLALGKAARASRSRRSLTPVQPVSHGYPPFKSELEKRAVLESPTLLNFMMSPTATPSLKCLSELGILSTHSSLVREAVVAFTILKHPAYTVDSYRLSLAAYQRCTTELRMSRIYESHDVADIDISLTCIFMMAAVEALFYGDSRHCLGHADRCRALFASRVRRHPLSQTPAMLNLYRVIAESIMFNLATLSPFQNTTTEFDTTDWEDTFELVLPRDHYDLSPFFAGPKEIYRVMFMANQLSHKYIPGNTEQPTKDTLSVCSRLSHDLDQIEDTINRSHHNTPKGAASNVALYARYMLTILSLRIHIIKLSRPTATPTDGDVRSALTQAIIILSSQDCCEPELSVLRWPLTIFGCACATEDQFTFLHTTMQRGAVVMDLASRRKLLFACSALSEHWNATNRGTHYDVATTAGARINTLDLLLNAARLDDTRILT